MAQFFALTPLNAANFESGAATEGQVLTADGAGGAAFEDAAGGALANHDHSGDAGDGGKFDAANLNSTTTEAVVGSITVSGAGSTVVNGTYSIVDTNEGKNVYATSLLDYYIYWHNFGTLEEPDCYWMITDADNYDNLGESGIIYYFSDSDVATPDLAEWDVDAGEGPVPTVAETEATHTTDGYVLTADGAGNAVWEATPGKFSYDGATIELGEFDGYDMEFAITPTLNGVAVTSGDLLLRTTVFNIGDSSVAGTNKVEITATGTHYAKGIDDEANEWMLWIDASADPGFILTKKGTIGTGRLFVNLPTGAFVMSDVIVFPE